MTQNFTERPAIGTRVTLPEEIGDTAWYRHNAGKSGVVYDHRHDGETVRVRFDDGEEDFGFWTALTPEVTSPAPEITLNGHRYVLAETPTPEVKEEQRQPKRGEVWRDTDDYSYVLITGNFDEDNDPEGVIVSSGPDTGWVSFIRRTALEFAYPSLAAFAQNSEAINPF